MTEEQVSIRLEEANPGFTFKSIESITASSKTGKMYQNSEVFRGKVKFKLTNEGGDEKLIELTFLVEDMVSSFKEFLPFDLSIEERRQVDSKVTKLAYFFDGSEIDERIKEQAELIRKIWLVILIISIALVVVLAVAGVIYARTISRKLTAKIIDIYLLLDHVIATSSKKQGFELTFRPSNKELNEL